MEVEILFSDDDDVVICCYCGCTLPDDSEEETCMCKECWNKYYSRSIQRETE